MKNLLRQLAGVGAIVSLSSAVVAEPARLPAGAAGSPARLSLTAKEREPATGRDRPSGAELERLRSAVAESPGDRARRFQLVRGLMIAGDLDAALVEAKAWRERDAYNLVVVRLLGDIHAERGERERARRAYSAVVELLPGDPEAQRALSHVLKQSGDLVSAHERLVAAEAMRPDDVRLGFELADLAQRLGRVDEAAARFRRIIEAPTASRAITHPARQRLGQIEATRRREALARGDAAEAKRRDEAIAALGVTGGVENDIKVYLTWDTDRSDVDLWVKTPGGEVVNYQRKTGSGGEALFDDVTTGYGPESFTAKRARPGEYVIQVNYFGTSRQAFTEARGEVVVVLGEGTASETKHVLPYRLFEKGQTVTVGIVEVAR